MNEFAYYDLKLLIQHQVLHSINMDKRSLILLLDEKIRTLSKTGTDKTFR